MATLTVLKLMDKPITQSAFHYEIRLSRTESALNLGDPGPKKFGGGTNWQKTP